MTHLEKTQRETYSQVHHNERQAATFPLWLLLSFHLLAKGQCWLLPSPKRNTHLGGSGLVVHHRSQQSRREILNWKTTLCVQIGNCASSLPCPCRGDDEDHLSHVLWDVTATKNSIISDHNTNSERKKINGVVRGRVITHLYLPVSA